MKSRLSVAALGMALLAAAVVWGHDEDKKDKKNESKPVLGKVFYADAKSGKWVQLTSGPEDNIFLDCMDAAGKFRPCVIEAMQPAGLESPEFPASFLLQLKPHQKSDANAKR
jgi:hypothetical protein